MSKNYCFHVTGTPDGTLALIAPTDYFITHGCLPDRFLNIKNLIPEYLSEDLECMFFSSKSVEQTKKDLLAKGFIELKEFSKVCEAAFGVLGEFL